VSKHVEVFKDASGEWRWRTRAANGEIVATSGEGYEHHIFAVKAAKEEATGLPIVELHAEQHEPHDAA
jgi:uncharacterized protein YegP (UPF0339 family)